MLEVGDFALPKAPVAPNASATIARLTTKPPAALRGPPHTLRRRTWRSITTDTVHHDARSRTTRRAGARNAARPRPKASRRTDRAVGRQPGRVLPSREAVAWASAATQ